LETAQKLAETERARAEEQAKSAKRLRQRALFLGVALAVAVVMIVVAVVLAQQSSQNAAVAQENADIASTREAEALIESEQRATAQAQAEDQAQLAFSRELAAAALNNLDVDPERSILLALQALSVTHTLDAENALHQAIRTSRVRQTLVPTGGLRSIHVIYCPDGRRLFTSGVGGSVMWDLDTETILYEIPSAGIIKHSEFSPDGSLLALPEDLREAFGNNPLGEYFEDAGEGDAPLRGYVTLVEAETGNELITFVAHEIFAQLVNFSRDGRRLVTTSAGEVKVWDVEALLSEGGGQPLLDLEGHEEIVWMARFSPDGKLLATSGNKLTFIWDAQTGEELLRLDIPAYDLIFSPDGSLLLTAHIGTVDAWDIESGQKVFSTPAHAHDIESMRLSPDGRTIATMGNDGKAKLFDYSNDGLRERMTLAGHSVTVGTGDFSPDGRYLATGSLDGTVRISPPVVVKNCSYWQHMIAWH
jgi:WD40 repeat protein